jgi:iron complex outermembrane recepter protein
MLSTRLVAMPAQRLALQASAIILAALVPGSIAAEAGGTWRISPDTLIQHEMQEVVIRAVARPAPATQTVFRLSAAEIVQHDAASASELVRLLPGAQVQTNSRGEAVVYLRNAGEREVAVVFDGALLNVPWDNRIDLGVVPAGIVDGIEVAKGVPSVRFGANAGGGVIELRSDAERPPGSAIRLGARTGAMGFRDADAAAYTTAGRFVLDAAAGFTTRDALSLSRRTGTLHNQDSGTRRANSDVRRVSLLGRAGTEIGTARIGLTVLHSSGSKGVAPEGHRDPSAGAVRFWRYPHWQATMLIARSEVDLGPQSVLEAVGWVNRFNQEIEAFNSPRFDTITATQEDVDGTSGARLLLRHRDSAGSVLLALSGLTSEHRQRDVSWSGTLPDKRLPDSHLYRQHLGSMGIEYEPPPIAGVHAVVGLSAAVSAYPKTGDKPSRDPFYTIDASAGARYRGPQMWSIRAQIGQTTRFPTPRELFGEALQRFLLNPNLNPEESLKAEIGLALHGTWYDLEFVPFGSRSSNLVDQQIVMIDGRPMRQRVNLSTARVYGVEMSAVARPARWLSATGHVMLSDARGSAGPGESLRPLSEQPATLGRITTRFQHSSGASLLLDMNHTGRAHAPADDNTIVRLDGATIFDIRFGYWMFSASGQSAVELFARVNNVGDVLLMPRLGLPEPGRTLRAGAKLSLSTPTR